jgi:hypothetical protein
MVDMQNIFGDDEDENMRPALLNEKEAYCA